MLPLDAERFTTGCEKVHASRTLSGHQTCNGVYHAAIVQNERHARVTQSATRLCERVFGIEVDVNGSTDLAEDESRVDQPREIDAPNAIHVSADQPLGGGHCDRALADPARSNNGDQPLRRKPALQPGDEIIASDQRCEEAGRLCSFVGGLEGAIDGAASPSMVTSGTGNPAPRSLPDSGGPPARRAAPAAVRLSGTSGFLRRHECWATRARSARSC